jgi:RND family efflux transporter MFP subunit
METTKKGFFKRKWIKWALIAIAAIIIVYFSFFNKKADEYVLTEAVIGDIVQTVSVTGTIKADPSLDIHFKKTGTVDDIFIKEGERILKGDLLASLENDSLALEVERMRANYNYAVAQYNQVKAGAKSEEILIAEADLQSAEAQLQAALIERDNTRAIGNSNIELAEIEYNKAQKDYDNTVSLAEKELAKLDVTGDNAQSIALESAYANAFSQLDSLFPKMQDAIIAAESVLGVRGSGYYYLPQTTKNQLIAKYHTPAENALEEALTLYNALGPNPANEELSAVLDKSLEAADAILLLLSQTTSSLDALAVSRPDRDDLILKLSSQATTLSQATLQLEETNSTIKTLTTGSLQDIETLKLSYQLQIDQAENLLDQAEYNLNQAKLNAEIADSNSNAFVALKQAALDSAKATLSLKQSPVRSVDLAPLSAQISQADIALQIAQNALGDSQLYAPIDGIVTFIYGKVGENIALTETSLKPFLSMQADNLIVEANVPETDVVKIEPGDKVEMTVDAFDFTEKLDGEVIYIDPAETVIQGVVYYQIKTAFDIEDPRLKSGMTTNLDIITDKKENILIIPTRAVKFENSTRYVEILINGKPKKVTIQTGLESDQFVEVTDGLKEGDKIITFVK